MPTVAANFRCFVDPTERTTMPAHMAVDQLKVILTTNKDIAPELHCTDVAVTNTRYT